MSGKRVLVAVVCGFVTCVALVMLGEVAIGIAGRQVVRWLADGVPLTGWRHAFAATSDFFARYFALMSPLILVLSVSGAILAARALSKDATA